MASKEHTHNTKNTLDYAMYRRLGVMLIVSFVAMFVLMYAMVDTVLHALPNLNQVYMAGLMTAAMLVIELIVMHSMYVSKKLNVYLIIGGVIALALCWFGIRAQFLIGDKAFLESMIPHHSGAVLMCEQATLSDPEVIALCNEIIHGQTNEIDWMSQKLQNI